MKNVNLGFNYLGLSFNSETRQNDEPLECCLLSLPPPSLYNLVSLYLIFGFPLSAKWQYHSSNWSNNLPAAAKAFPSDNLGWISTYLYEGWIDAFGLFY